MANKGKINMSEANEQACGESIANLCSAPARKGAAIGTDVQPTAGAQIAQWLQEVEAPFDCPETTGSYADALEDVRAETAVRLRSILNAINAST
jgi:hypothetical protein